MDRRGFLRGLAVALAAPAVIRTPGLLMPIKVPLRPVMRVNGIVSPGAIMQEMLAIMRNQGRETTEQQMMDNLVFGCSIARTTDDFPFVERVDPRQFFNPECPIPREIFSV